MAGTVPRCQVVPLPDDQISMTVEGRELTRWHFGARYPRPFFYPVIGPGGSTLTRMGHPGDPSHDHHRSVWFAHEKVSGVDFWSDRTTSQIRQLEWLAFAGGEDEAVMVVRLGWFDGHDPQELMVQELVAAVRPSEEPGAWQIELQSSFTPRAETLELGQTNFGMIAVRVAESVSAYFGGGTITGADGSVGEPALFGQPNRWMDYSGPVRRADGSIGIEGLTLHDHPSNVNHPSKWHVREDGWMGPSVCRDAAVMTTRGTPLVLRSLLEVHAGEVVAERAEKTSGEFSQRAGFVVERSRRKHRRYEVGRG